MGSVPGPKLGGENERCSAQTDNRYGLASEPKSTVKTHVLAATTGRPQSNAVLRPEEQHQYDLLHRNKTIIFLFSRRFFINML